MTRFYSFMLLSVVFALLSSKLFGQAGTVNYTPSTEDFANPERGFMQFTETNSTNYSPLNATDLAFWRTLNQPFGADYSIYSTLGYRGFYLESFTNGPISNAYLDAMQQDFNAVRQAGVKLVIRFAYTHKFTPPYGDAPKSIVLQHIAQLKPILQANADVIASLNMGFIGTWGEGYYTDHFGDDSQPPYGLTAQNWNDRTEVLNALLDAMPADRSVQVRIPQMKQKAVYGTMAPVNSAPLTVGEAWQNTHKARIGFHNDCFLSGDDDQGTFKNYDTGVSGSDTTAFKPYFSFDSQFVPVGGETCVDWDPYSNCTGQPGGGAEIEMARMHFSYLNAGWNNAVNNDWVSGGCMEEIKQRLGYRLELQNGEFPTDGSPRQAISIKIELKNKGFAAPFNPRKVRLLMRNVLTNALWDFDLPEDPRRWLPGNQIHKIEHTFCLPADMPGGNYELLLQLADPYPELSNRPEYAIRLANENTWEAATGFNRLLHQMAVIDPVPHVENVSMCQGGSATCAGQEFFAPGNFPVTLPAYQGCDSVVHCNITVVPTYISPMKFVNLCFPATHQVCEETYTQTGVYATHCTGFLGCDSILNIDLAVMQPIAQLDPPSPLDCGPNPIVTLSGTGSNLNTAMGGATLYEWTGPGIIGANNQPTVQVNHPGQYCLILKHGRGGVYCSDTACATVSAVPQASFINGILNSTPAVAYQWLLNGIPIPGATNQTFVPTVSGDYTVQVDCQGTGWVTSNIVPVVIVGISEAIFSVMKIYPNPVTETESSLVLEVQGLDNQPIRLVVTDLAGRELFQKTEAYFSGKTILNAGGLASGSYFVQLWKDGKLEATGMFLKL